MSVKHNKPLLCLLLYTIINMITVCYVWLTHHCIFIYVLNTSGWQALKNSKFPDDGHTATRNVYRRWNKCTKNSVQDLVIFKTIHLSKNEKYLCRIETVSSPDDGHIVARNMYRSWKKYTKNSVQNHVIFKTSHLSKNEKYLCRIDKVSSSDDGNIVARNMYRSWNKYTKN